MVQILVASVLLGLTLYFTHIKRDLRPMVVFLTLAHIFAIWGIFSIFGNINGAIISVITITIIVGISLVGYIFQNLKLSEDRLKYKEQLNDLYAELWDILEGEGDPFDFVIRFDKLYNISNVFADDEDKKTLEKIISVIISRKDIFALKELRMYAMNNKIQKKRWWFYLWELVKDANGV